MFKWEPYQSNEVICAEAYLGSCLFAIIICLISAEKINDARAASKMAADGVPTPRPGRGVSISTHSLPPPPTDRRPLDPQRINLDKPSFPQGLQKTDITQCSARSGKNIAKLIDSVIECSLSLLNHDK